MIFAVFDPYKNVKETSENPPRGMAHHHHRRQSGRSAFYLEVKWETKKAFRWFTGTTEAREGREGPTGGPARSSHKVYSRTHAPAAVIARLYSSLRLSVHVVARRRTVSMAQLQWRF